MQLHAKLQRVLARRWAIRPAAPLMRHGLIACIVTLLAGALLLAITQATGWGKRHAISSDTRSVATQASEQLLRSLTSRRGTLTFIRDTLNRQADLSATQLRAIGASATGHTRHLVAIGLVRSNAQPDWWFDPEDLSEPQQKTLNAALQQRLQLRGIWQVPSTFTADLGQQRQLLCMLEPLAASVFPTTAILGIFESRPLLRDFFSSGLARRHPVRVTEGAFVLYQSPGWHGASESELHRITEEAPLAIDALRWTIEVQPGRSRLIQALSVTTVVVTGLSLLAGLGIVGIAWILAARTWVLEQAVARRTAALRRTLVRLRQLATTDELTGLHNRRFFFSRWAAEFDRAHRYGRPLSCLMIDINGFKQVNDRLGHMAGDRLLQRVSAALRKQFRQSDTLARLGGDEFIVALTETDIARAEQVAEKLRKLRIPAVDESPAVAPIRLSVGSACNGDPAASSQDIIQAADVALYEDKRRSRSEDSPAAEHAKSAFPSKQAA